MKLLVVGASGQLAQSLAEIPLAEGDRLTAIGRPEIDLLKPKTIEAGIANAAPDLVINAAAYTAVDKAESEPQLAYAINAEGAGLVATCCKNSRIPLIHISTDYVFDGLKSGPYMASDLATPVNVYGQSKLAGERRVFEECSNSVVLRSAWIHSAFGSNFVRTMLHIAEHRDEISVVTDQFGNPTYAPHLAGIIVSLAKIILSKEAHEVPRGIYNVAGSGDVSRVEFAEQIFLQSEKWDGPSANICPVASALYSSAAIRPINSCLDCTKLTKQFGLALPDWRVGVAECVARICTG